MASNFLFSPLAENPVSKFPRAAVITRDKEHHGFDRKSLHRSNYLAAFILSLNRSQHTTQRAAIQTDVCEVHSCALLFIIFIFPHFVFHIIFTTIGSSMNSLVRPRTASPHSPPIKHARSLSPRSVMFDCEFPNQVGGNSQELQHLQQPLQDSLDYDDYFRDCSSNTATAHRPLAPSRNNKRKLISSDLPPRSVLNLRHRQVSNETMEWLVSFSSNRPSVTNATHPISDTDEDDVSCKRPHQSSPAFRALPPTEQTISRTMATSSTVVREPVEELWLGPVFESSQTVLMAIASLPISVTHLDLDLRNALHLLPQAMPLLFGKHHLKTLSLRLYGDAGAVELAKWMNHNPNLERLDLRGNRIGSMGARNIIDAIMACGSDHNNSNNINNNNNCNNSSLTHLNLSCNCILHGEKIGELLAVNSTMEALDLGYNWLGNEEVDDICSIGLCKNTSLRELNLYGNHRISHKGMKVVLRCLKEHNTSLHKIGLQSFDEEGERLIKEINYWLKLNKAGRYLIKTCLVSPSPSTEQGNQRNERQSPCHKSDPEPVAVPMGLWPDVLGKSNKDPDSLFHLVREGFGARIINYR